MDETLPTQQELDAGALNVAPNPEGLPKPGQPGFVTVDHAPKADTPSGNKQDVWAVPPHNHDDKDSNRFRAWQLLERRENIHIELNGTGASIAGNYGVSFIAMAPCFVRRIWEVHNTKSTSAGAVGLNVEKLTGTTAMGAGISMLSTDFDLKAANETVQKGVFFADRTKRNLDVGDRLALKMNGTPTGAADVLVQIEIEYI